MRLPWKRNTGEVYYEEEKPPKKKETLSQVAEKILMRKMKQDPDYGLVVAEKIKKIHHEPAKTLKDFLKEIEDYKEIMAEVGGGEGKGSWLRDLAEIMKQLPNAVGVVAQLPQIQAQVRQQQQIQTVQQIEEAQSQSTQQKKRKKEAPPSLDFEKIADLLQLEPQQAWEELQNRGETQWVDYLGTTSYEELCGILEKYADHPQYGTYIKEFLNNYSRWLEDLVLCAHGKTEENE